MKSTRLKKLVLQGAMLEQSGVFLATVDNLPIISRGDTTDEAEDRLVKELKTWVKDCEDKGTLETSLATAGYPGVDRETEILLIFSDEEE